MSTTPIRDLLERDHDRLSALLDAACQGTTIVAALFHPFRAGLLRHIAMEEKILLPAARQARAGESLPLAKQMKLDHAALAGLLVPTPTMELVGRLRALLEAHNAMEEGDDGVYAQCEQAIGLGCAGLMEALRNAPPVKLAPYQDGPRTLAALERLLQATGRI